MCPKSHICPADQTRVLSSSAPSQLCAAVGAYTGLASQQPVADQQSNTVGVERGQMVWFHTVLSSVLCRTELQSATVST